MSKQLFYLTTDLAKRNAIQAIASSPQNTVCEIKERKRTLDQNARLHAMFGDIAKQVAFFGQKRDLETVKRLLVDAFARVKAEMGEPLPGHGYTLPSLDGQGIVQLGIQTRRLSVSHTAELIDYLFAWGNGNNVVWSERVDIPEWVK